MRAVSLRSHVSVFMNRLALLFALGWLPASLAHAQEPQNFIVTDLDDTVKLTDVLHAPDAVIRATFSRKTFAGMSTLYREISARNANSTLYFVTGSPKFLREPIVSLVVENKFPKPWMLSLRDLSTPTPEFKIKTISEILEGSGIREGLPSDAKLILVGDDGEQDPETYAALRAKFPNRIAAIYIHRIQARAIPVGEFAYDTAMDIALHEMENARLSPEQAVKVGKAVLEEGKKDSEKMVISYNFCPTSFEAVSQHDSQPQSAEAYALSAQIRDQIKNICTDRAEDEARERDRRDGS